MHNLWERQIVQVQILHSSFILPCFSITTYLTLCVVFLVVEIFRLMAASTLGRLVILLLAFWNILGADLN